jgi:hypothetical protein
MSVEATTSHYKKNTHKIFIAALVLFGAYCIYDGYFNEKFVEKHVSETGEADSTLAFNRKSPPILFGAAILIGANLARIWTKKVVAGETSLNVCGTDIAYDSIESINKTHFDSKGFFTIAYKDSQGSEKDIKISDKDYDGLPTVLDEVVAKIS